MPEALPYMRLWVRDLLSDPAVHAMDEAEFGVYMLCLFYAWTEGGIPADPKARAKQLGITPRKLERIWPALQAKWISDGNGHLVNPRQEREREEAIAKHQKRVAAGRKGGRPKGNQ